MTKKVRNVLRYTKKFLFAALHGINFSRQTQVHGKIYDGKSCSEFLNFGLSVTTLSVGRCWKIASHMYLPPQSLIVLFTKQNATIYILIPLSV